MAGRLFLGLYFFFILALFFYSFTQIDLNLTLINHPFWYMLQKPFMDLGYYLRPVSTVIYLFITILMFIGQILLLKLVMLDKFSQKTFWKLVVGIVLILFLSYPAFSYDIYNYIFDARIVTEYNLNPYEHKALDFPADDWTRFMRWTHRTYPYGPSWLGISIPLSFVGFGYLLPTILLFKGVGALSYLGCLGFLKKIADSQKIKNSLLPLILFGLNPIVIIESLVSAHHDIVMMFLALAAVYLLINKRYFWSLIFLLLSAGIKFTTLLLLPLFLWKIIVDKKNKSLAWEKWNTTALVLMLTAVILAVLRTEFQAWYLIWVLPFAALLPSKKLLQFLIIGLSFGLLLRYAPFIYQGDWNPPVPAIKTCLTAGGVILATVVYIFNRYIRIKK